MVDEWMNGWHTRPDIENISSQSNRKALVLRGVAQFADLRLGGLKRYLSNIWSKMKPLE
jgi:hypothetical protein